MDALIYHELTYNLNGIYFKVHNQLGRFGKERQYGDAIEMLLKEKGVAYKREYEVSFMLDGNPVKGNRVDFIIEDKIVLELKAKPLISKDDYLQMKRYLTASGYKLGIIVNFRQQYLKPRRVLNPNSTSGVLSVVSVDQHANL